MNKDCRESYQKHFKEEICGSKEQSKGSPCAEIFSSVQCMLHSMDFLYGEDFWKIYPEMKHWRCTDAAPTQPQQVS